MPFGNAPASADRALDFLRNLDLRNNGPTRFGALKREIQGISSKVLTERLRMLEETEIIYREYKPSIPPEVTYGLTERGKDSIVVLDRLAAIAYKWYEQENEVQQTVN